MEYLPCNIIIDLLPSYIDGLASPESVQAVETHLEHCPLCREAYTSMKAEMMADVPLPRRQLSFLRRLKRRQLVGALVSLLLTLVCLVGLYNYTFPIQSDKTSLEQAIEEYYGGFGGFYPHMEVEVLETARYKNWLLAFYQKTAKENEYGIFVCEKGLNGSYRFASSHEITRPLWAGVAAAPITFGDTTVIAVGGYNCGEIDSYSLTFNGISGHGVDLADEMRVHFPCEDPQFFTILTTDALETQSDGQLPPGSYGTAYTFGYSSNLYNAQGEDVTEQYRYEGELGLSSGAGGGYPESFTREYVMMALILLIGIIFIRYFLTTI